jgi:uncharacterized membrane protein
MTRQQRYYVALYAVLAVIAAALAVVSSWLWAVLALAYFAATLWYVRRPPRPGRGKDPDNY